jgi:predicted amidohydrolase
MYSILLRKVRLIDGTGALERVVDIAIEGDEVVAVDENINARAVETIDGGF